MTPGGLGEKRTRLTLELVQQRLGYLHHRHDHDSSAIAHQGGAEIDDWRCL